MAKKKQEQKGWAIYTDTGTLLIKTIRFKREDCIGMFQGHYMNWRRAYRNGWSCRKVKITEI